LFLALACQGVSQTPQDLVVELTAQVSENPNLIMLKWPVTNASAIKVYRKTSIDDPSFSTPIATLSGASAQYTDTDIELGKAYEYRVEKEYAAFKANGYILSGIKVLRNENRGKLILLVEASLSGPLANELKTLEKDIIGDGWSVIRLNVQATETASGVRDRIIQSYNTAPSEVKAVFIIGHVAVPYSGLIAPDGHSDHLGAWPADGYYGDMDGNWTDTSVNNSNAFDSRNHNVPGDGKFDQSELPSNLELQVGRVDFFDLDVFSDSETELTRKYLNKNHAFRNREFVATQRALIDDNFGGGQNSFSSSAFRSFYTMFSPDNVQEKDYFSTMSVESYLWSHGNGPGFYNSVRDVGESFDYATNDVKSVFTMLFGSYLGDWDSKNNIMRSSLASGSILTCAWSGLPQWQFHQMALGETIGYCAKNTANAFEYDTANNSKMIHVALLGDPTLRMHTISPPTSLEVVKNGQIDLTWAPSSENVLGYHVYSRINETGEFQRQTSTIISGTSFNTTNTEAGLYTYMVRAVALEETPSGSYYNLSQGVFASIQLDENGESEPVDEEEEEEEEQEEEEQEEEEQEEEQQQEQEEPQIDLLEVVDQDKIIIYPNPATEVAHIESTIRIEEITISDISGKLFLTPSNTDIDVSTLPSGFYIVQYLADKILKEQFLIKQ